MIATTKIQVGAFKLPYFPPRPMTGPKLTSWASVMRFAETHAVQPKLNGDRACLAATDGELWLQNRHGAFYKQSCDLTNWLPLKRGAWLLDGEVWQKRFYPFEAIIVDGLDISAACPTERIQRAKELTRATRLEWMFDFPLQSWVEAQLRLPKSLSRQWEGIVAKRLGSKYIQAGTATAESPHWVKVKW